jgi:hypothetical protein
VEPPRRDLRRERVIGRPRDLLFIAGGGALFTVQLLRGAVLWSHPHDSGVVNEIADPSGPPGG